MKVKEELLSKDFSDIKNIFYDKDLCQFVGFET